MVKKRDGPIAATALKFVEQKELHGFWAFRVAVEIREVLSNVGARHFLFEQVALVHEQYDAHIHKVFVVHNGLKDRSRLDDAICAPILLDYLIILRRRDHKQNACDVLEALKPLLTLRALPANVDEAKRDALNFKRVLRNGSWRFAAEEDVLIRWIIILAHYAINVIEEVDARFTDLK